MAYVLRGPTRALVIGAALLMTATIQGWSVLVAGAEGESPAPALLSVDLPSANAMIQNGDIVDVAGWTDGSRVDIYLDGPAGIGAGLGSTIVHEARPDVVSTMAMPALVDSGFD
ncbi:MAG: hypothetical protein QOF51_315, partial [Chloroflexota bacterium]|nr:hypothetical protein [Chloroflexota bacterium]